jgi:Protein of unknown function (DUF4239)
MIRTWLDLSSTGIFATLIVLYFGMVLLLVTIAFCRPFANRIQQLTGIVAPFFGSVALLFALLVGFLAADISDRNRQALRAIHAEAGELRNIYTLSVAAVADMRTIRATLKSYANAVVSDEWPAMAQDRQSTRTDAAFDDLLREVSNPSIAKSSGNAVHAALLNAAVRLGTARNDRLSIAADHTNDLKWLTVIILGLFTQVAIGLVHLERFRAFTAALVVFSGAAVVALGIVALQEYPFYGTFKLSPAPIAQIQSLPETITPARNGS